MARDHAQVQLRIWDDDDWRDLSGNAQHLYLILLTHSTLSYCGVADWRPARLTGLVRDWDADVLQVAADELVDKLFILTDEDTEEVLLRSFIRNDGLMKQPKMAAAMATAYSSVGSSALRGVIVHELIRLHEDQPDLNGWKSDKALALLEKRPINPSVYPCGKGSVYPSGNPSGKGSATDTPYPSGKGSVKGAVKDPPTPTPTPTPTPKTSSLSTAPLRGARINEDFTPNKGLTAWGIDKGFTVDQLTEITAEFIDYWKGVAGAKGVKLDWDGTWRNWVRKQDPARVGNVRTLPTRSAPGRTFGDGTPMPWDR